jgi:hypothetical protein
MGHRFDFGGNEERRVKLYRSPLFVFRTQKAQKSQPQKGTKPNWLNPALSFVLFCG